MPLAVDLYLSAKRIPEARRAVDDFRKQLAERSDTVEHLADEATLLAAKVADADGDPVAALAALDTLSPAKPLVAEAWKLVWRACQATGQTRRGLRALEECANRSRRDVEAAKQLARAYREREWQGVLDLAARVEALDPTDLEAKLLRLEARIKTTSPDHAGGEPFRRLMDEIAALAVGNPRSGEIRVLQAGAAYRQGRAEESMAILDRAAAECDPDPNIDLAIASLSEQSGSRERAVEACRVGIARHPGSLSLRLKLAELQGADEAQETLQIASEQLTDENQLLATLALARHLLIQNQRQEAAELLRRLANGNPHDVRPRTALLALPEVRADAVLAQQLVDELKNIEGERRGTLWRLEQARLWLHAGELAPARQQQIESLLSECTNHDPSWSAPILTLARLHERMGRSEAAENVYRRFLESDPSDFEIAHRLLALLERQQRFNDAEQLLRRLPAEASSFAQHRLAVAMGQGDTASALRELEQRIASDPNDASLLVLKAGLVYSKQKDAEAAFKLLDQAQSLAPDSLDAVATRASVLQGCGRADEARALLNEVVKRRGDEQAYQLRARYFSGLEQFERAEQDLVHATQLAQASPESFLVLARFYVDRGKRLEAIAAFDAGLQKDAKNSELQRGLMNVFLSSSDPAERERGRGLLDVLQAQSPNDARLLMSAVQLRLADGSTGAVKEADSLLERVVALDARNVRAHILLIELARRRDDRRAVESLITRAIGANPDDADLQLVRADMEHDLGNSGVSRELARGVLERTQKEVRNGTSDDEGRRRIVGACALLAELALNRGELAEAKRYGDEAVQADPRNELAQLARAKVLDRTGDTAQAIAGLEEFLAASERSDSSDRYTGGMNATALNSFPVKIALADLNSRLHNFAVAESHLADALRQAPGNSAVRMTAMRISAAQDKWNEVVQSVQQAALESNVDLRTLILGASLLAGSDDPKHLQTARAACEQVIAQHPESVEAHVTFAQVAYEQRDISTCEQAYRKVLQLDPYNAQALNDLAWILATERSHLQEALTLADKGVARFADDPHLLDTRGVILYLLDRLPDARKELEKCLALPNQPASSRARTFFHLGRVHWKLGEKERARANVREALRLEEQRNPASRACPVFNEKERSELDEIMGAT